MCGCKPIRGHRGQKRFSGVLRCHVQERSPAEPGADIFSLDWQSASPSHLPVCVPLGASVTGMHKTPSRPFSPLNLLWCCCCSVEIRTQGLADARKAFLHSSFIVCLKNICSLLVLVLVQLLLPLLLFIMMMMMVFLCLRCVSL